MARAFDSKERIRVHETLLETGCRLFGQYGFNKTNIDQIATEAGIAKGTFYQFWKSKEAFFFACLEETEEQFQEEVLEPHLASGRHPADILGSLISETIKSIDEYPLFAQALDPVLMNRLVRRLPPEVLEHHHAKDRAEFSAIAEAWDSDEFDPGVSPEVMDGLFKGILMMGLHRELIGKDVFPKVMDVMATVLAKGFRAMSDQRINRRKQSRQRKDHK